MEARSNFRKIATTVVLICAILSIAAVFFVKFFAAGSMNGTGNNTLFVAASAFLYMTLLLGMVQFLEANK